MRITDILRQHAHPVQDRIAGFNKRIDEAESERNAAGERIKRASTEITRQRALENERKDALKNADKRVAEALRILEDLERRRQEAIDTLVRCQEEFRVTSSSLQDAHDAAESAVAEIRKEQKLEQDAQAEIKRISDERQTAKEDLRRALIRGVDLHLGQQTALLQDAFATQEQRSKAMRELEAFKKARHADAEIARLCEEREEIRKLLDDAKVAGVKAILQASLDGTEESLVARFPGVLQIPEQRPTDNQIEDLLFYRDRDEKVVFLLPIAATDWSVDASITERTDNAMCLVWNLILELGLRPEDGDFTVANGRPVFASKLDIEYIQAQSDLSVKRDRTEVIRYVFALVPSGLEEALSDEDQDD